MQFVLVENCDPTVNPSPSGFAGSSHRRKPTVWLASVTRTEAAYSSANWQVAPEPAAKIARKTEQAFFGKTYSATFHFKVHELAQGYLGWIT